MIYLKLIDNKLLNQINLKLKSNLILCKLNKLNIDNNVKCLSYYGNHIKKLKNEQKQRLQNKKDNLKFKLKQKENLVKQKLEGLKENIITIPNGLTVSRILMTPFLGYFILNNSNNLAFITFTLAGITDLVSWICILIDLKLNLLILFHLSN